jgi:hypothetical protein
MLGFEIALECGKLVTAQQRNVRLSGSLTRRGGERL